MDALSTAFKNLRKAGLVARQNFSCCSGCAGSQLANEAAARRSKGLKDKNGVVFFHRQDTEHLIKSGETMIRFGRLDTTEHGLLGSLTTAEVGEITAEILEMSGVKVEWNGDPSQCITAITPDSKRYATV